MLHIPIYKNLRVEFHNETTKEPIYFRHPIYEKYKKYFRDIKI